MQYLSYKLPQNKVGRDTIFKTPEKYNCETVRQQSTKRLYANNLLTTSQHSKSFASGGIKRQPDSSVQISNFEIYKNYLRKGTFHVDMLVQSQNNTAMKPSGIKIVPKQQPRDITQMRAQSACKLRSSSQMQEILMSPVNVVKMKVGGRQSGGSEYAQQFNNGHEFRKQPIRTSRRFEYASDKKGGFYV